MKVIGVLLELKFPFVRNDLLLLQCRLVVTTLHQILAHGSPMAVISQELTDRVNESGIGHLSSWTPQQLILNHPVSPSSFS